MTTLHIPDLHVDDIVLRTIVAFVLMLISARLLGKQMIAQMSYFDFVTNITLGSLTGAIILDHLITMGDLLLAIASFTAVSFLASFLSLKNRKVRKGIAGRPIELVRDGQILEKEMEQARVMMETLTQLLRVKDVFDISRVKQAMLEPSGELSVLLKEEYQPLTHHLLQQGVQNMRVPVELIIDGDVLTENLVRNNLDLAWLLQELEKQGAGDSKEVAYAVLTSQSRLYVDKYEDALAVPVQVKQ